MHERRVKHSWAWVMARPNNKRKEVSYVDLDLGDDVFLAEVSENHHKRPKLNDLPDIVGRILEARWRKNTRPLPVKIGSKAVDLVALHSRVHSLGGYSKVTESKLWSTVSEALGFGSDCGPAVKLVYVKYLKALETDRRREKRYSQNGVSDEEVIGDLRGRDQGECRQSAMSEDWVEKNPSCSRDDGSSPGASEDWYEGVREENVQQQREALRGMLEWIRCAAVCPGDDSVGTSGQLHDANDLWASQCQMLTAKVRSVLWKETARAGDGFNQGRQMPSLYYEDTVRPDAQTLEKLRATRERLESYGFQPPPGPKSQDWGTAGTSYPGQRSGRHAANSYHESAFGYHNQQRKRIPLGPQFQADIPVWVPRDRVPRGGEDAPGSSDDAEHNERWLGVQVWPPVAGAVDSAFRPVGRGRPASCDCPEPGSIHCVRVHIAAARARLRSELGPAFVAMGLDQMGEYVADQAWSKEEERTFRLVARLHPASKSLNFWDYLPDALPHKTRMELNSYYFNVFVLRRRALQNRLGGVKIDSDDDEGELPGESEESEYGSTDNEDDDEEDELFSDSAEDEDVLVKVPTDAAMLKFRPLAEFNYIPPGEVAHSRAPMGSSLMGLEEDNHIAPDNSHAVLVWDDKHLESGSLVREGPQWGEHPHWDGRDHLEVGPGVLGEAVPSRQLSPPKEDVRQGAALGDLWSQSMEMAPKREKDKLLSTNGMILELFGDDICRMQNDTFMFANR